MTPKHASIMLRSMPGMTMVRSGQGKESRSIVATERSCKCKITHAAELILYRGALPQSYQPWLKTGFSSKWTHWRSDVCVTLTLLIGSFREIRGVAWTAGFASNFTMIVSCDATSQVALMKYTMLYKPLPTQCASKTRCGKFGTVECCLTPAF